MAGSVGLCRRPYGGHHQLDGRGIFQPVTLRQRLPRSEFERRADQRSDCVPAWALRVGSFRFETPDASLLLLISPGQWHEKMFREMGEPAIERRLPDNGGSFAPAELGAIANTYGSHIVGPPPTR